jgi:signal transduction histidine kinase
VTTLLAFLAGAAVGAGGLWYFIRERERLRAKLLSFVAHELNTPVSALNMTILNFLEGLFGEVPEDQKPWLVLVREQIARLGALVGDLRDLIHEEFHRDLSLTRESVPLRPVVDKALEEMREAMARSEAEVVVEIPQALPKMYADPDRLARIVTAMLTHARKFRAKGPIELAAASAGGRQTFTILYQGSEAERRHYRDALDLYFPARNADSQILSSTGLGLGLPARLVRAHEGQMRLESSGTRMRLEIEMPENGASS